MLLLHDMINTSWKLSRPRESVGSAILNIHKTSKKVSFILTFALVVFQNPAATEFIAFSNPFNNWFIYLKQSRALQKRGIFT